MFSSGEGQFVTAGGVALVADGALPAAVVVQVAGAAGAHTVHFSMGELGAFHVHFDLLWRGEKSKERKVIQRSVCNIWD